jgi:cobalt-zinc-cadmium resistance protein CzcA
MIKRLVMLALYQPLLVLVLAALFIASGLAAFQSLPIEAFPDVTDVQVTTITLFPGHAAEEVEKQITIPLEIVLSGLPHAVRLFSHTQFGLSFVIVTFDDQVNDYFARQQVLERLQGLELPPGVQPNLAPLATPIGELYRFRLTGPGSSAMELRTLQDWVVARHLKMVPGVADVVTLGGFIKQYQVQPDLAKMHALNLPLQQLFTALGRGNGTPLLVKDIAQVSISAVPRQGLVGQDDEDEAVTGIVLMRKGENPSEVLTALKEKVAALNRSILPSGIKIVPFYDRTWLIHTTLKTVFKNLLEGALLVTCVLYLFLGNVRAAGIVAVVIPLSLLATFLGLRVRGIPANLLSLGAMDFGIIVDGAVIVVENVFRHLGERHRTPVPQDVRATILEATTEVGRPTFFSMLIVITAHLPIFTLQWHEGRIFAPMAYTVTSALIGSLLFSLTLVPLLCFLLLHKGVSERDNLVVRFSKRLYYPLLAWALTYRKTMLTLALGMLAGSLAIVPHLGSEFLPELNEGTLWVNIMLPPSISVTETSRLCRQIRTILRQFPEVNSVVSKAGRPEDGTDPKMINMTEFFVDLKPPAEWTRPISKAALVQAMDTALDAIPGIESSFSQPIRDNVLESISQIDGQIVIKVFGEEPTRLREYAQKVLKTITPVRGVARAFIDRFGSVPQLQIEVDRQRAARYGLNVADVQDVIETALGGKSATDIWEGEKRFRVVVRLREDERRLEAIKHVLIDTPGGARVPLDSVATLTIQAGSMNISRESGMRVMAIGVFIRDRDMGSVVAEMQQRVKADVVLPAGYFVTWGGEFENQQRAMARLAVIVPASVFLIFALLFNTFNSLKSALVILVNVPFALIGGIVGLWVTGIPLSVSAAIGFIALFGQAVLNGVVMVSYFNQLRDAGHNPMDAVLQGAMVRLRTVMMTALLAMLGLLPMALAQGIGSETQKPLAVVIIGGLLSATLLTLLVLPALYLLFEGRGWQWQASPAAPTLTGSAT